MYLKNNKGVTLLALTITIIVMLIITSTVIYNTNAHIKMEKRNKLYNDIESIGNKIEDYYLKYGELPVLGKYVADSNSFKTLLQSNASSNNAKLSTVDNQIVNPNDSEEYYIIQLEKLDGLILNYGYGDDYNNAKSSIENSEAITTDIDEIYVINKDTHQIYFPAGIFVDDFMYYTYNMDSNEALNSNTIESSNGALTVNNAKAVTVDNFKIYGNTEITGLNLYDKMTFTEGYTLTNTGTSAKASYKVSDFIEVVPSSNYFFKMATSANTMYICCLYDENQTFISRAFTNYSDKVGTYQNEIITRSNAKYIRISCGIADNDIEIYQLGDITEYPTDLKTVGELITDENDVNYNKYKIPVKVTGKNMFNIEDFAKVYGPCEFPAYQGEFVDEFEDEKDLYKIYGRSVADHTNYKYMNGDFKENTQYTFSLKIYDVLNTGNGLSGINISWVYTDGTTDYILINDVTRAKKAGSWTTYTDTSLKGKTVSCITLSYGTGAAYSYIKDIQLEEGAVTTEYEPYKETIKNVYLDEPLRKVGDYADYIDLINKKVIRKIKGVQLTSLTYWYSTHYPIIEGLLTSDYAMHGVDIINNYSGKEHFGVSNVEGTGLGFYDCDTFWGFADETDVEKWLDEREFIVNYVLKTPKEEKIDIPDILNDKSIKRIVVDTDTTPSNIELKYYEINN